MKTSASGPARWLAEVYLPQIPAPRTPVDPVPPSAHPHLARHVVLLVACLLALFAVLAFTGALLHR